MIILGIETSCDETAASVVEDGRRVLADCTASSAKELSEYGGVFPEVAARRQVEYIIPVLSRAVGGNMDAVDAIAVTRGPGLLTSLLVGVTAARILSSVWEKPLIGVNHIFGHMSSTWINCEDDIEFPILTLSVSGGHTELWMRESHTRCELIGKTRDDAAGEAFDKGAALLGIPYPGGPSLAKLANGGNPFYVDFVNRSSPFRKNGSGFSFSGLKTALKYYIRDGGGLNAFSTPEKKDIAASYQHAICEHLVSRLSSAVKRHADIREVHLVGGVSRNMKLRKMAMDAVNGRVLRMPEPRFCTDNAAMIASAGYFMLRETGDKSCAAFGVGDRSANFLER